MTKKLRLSQEVFSKWPEPHLRTLAEDIEENLNTVSGWSKRGSVPGHSWQRIVTAAKKRRLTGVTLALLADIHAKEAQAA